MAVNGSPRGCYLPSCHSRAPDPNGTLRISTHSPIICPFSPGSHPLRDSSPLPGACLLDPALAGQPHGATKGARSLSPPREHPRAQGRQSKNLSAGTALPARGELPASRAQGELSDKASCPDPSCFPPRGPWPPPAPLLQQISSSTASSVRPARLCWARPPALAPPGSSIHLAAPARRGKGRRGAEASARWAGASQAVSPGQKDAATLPWKWSAVFRLRASTVLSSVSAHSKTSLRPYRCVLWHRALKAFCRLKGK